MTPTFEQVFPVLYRGWQTKEAQADFDAGNWKNKAGAEQFMAPQTSQPRSSQQIVEDIIKAQEEQINRESKFLEQYTSDNPFVFDEELARQSATQEYEPYYSEILNDYLDDIGVNRDSLQSEEKLLTSLTSTPRGTAGQAERTYQRAISQAQQGFAEKGVFFSGTAKRALGEAETERGAILDKTATNVLRKERDVGREQDVAIEGGVLQRQQEALKQYYSPLEQSYFRQFPSGSRTSLQGYVPSDYMRL